MEFFTFLSILLWIISVIGIIVDTFWNGAPEWLAIVSTSIFILTSIEILLFIHIFDGAYSLFDHFCSLAMHISWALSLSVLCCWCSFPLTVSYIGLIVFMLIYEVFVQEILEIEFSKIFALLLICLGIGSSIFWLYQGIPFWEFAQQMLPILSLF